MNTARLGRTGLDITRTGIGAWAMGGGDWAFGWGPQDDADSIAAIHRGLERGMNWIDTAAVYGLGHSEEVVRRALETWSGERPLVFTKCEQTWTGDGRVVRRMTRDSVLREHEASTRRLGVDVLDLLQIHWPQPDDELEEGWRTLCELRDQGAIRFAGVSNFDVGQLERAGAIGPVDTLQPPYSLLRRDVEEEILPYCAEHDIGVIVYSPMASGLLAGRYTRERVAALPENDWRRTSREFTEPNLTRNLELVERLRAVGERHCASPGEVAIAWTLRQPAVTGAIVGVRRADQVDGIAGAAALELDEDDVAALEGARV